MFTETTIRCNQFKQQINNIILFSVGPGAYPRNTGCDDWIISCIIMKPLRTQKLNDKQIHFYYLVYYLHTIWYTVNMVIMYSYIKINSFFTLFMTSIKI